MLDIALKLSKTQAGMAVDVGRAITAANRALVDASLAFATANANNQMALATAMMSAKSPDAVAESQRAYLNQSLQSASAMATQVAGALAAFAAPFAASAEALPGAAPAKDAL